MYKFISQYASKIDRATIYPMISLFIFFLFFIGLLVFVKKMDKQKVVELSNIPFETNETLNSVN